MIKNWPSKVFITGTDTGVGKTFYSSILTAELKGTYWKPIQCGIDPLTDTQWVQRETKLSPEHFHQESYCLKMPASPHLAAAQENTTIELSRIQIPKTTVHHPLIIEGAGGVMVPLNQKELMLDLIKHLDIGTIVVARSTLGTINHTLMTLKALRDHKIFILGVVMNGPKDPENKRAIETYGKVKVITELEYVKN